jgi:hypothetical protein
VRVLPGRAGDGWDVLRDVGGADAVAVRDGREALHVHVEQPPEGGGLGVAELRELRGHVAHRAVVLAQLDAEAVLGRGGRVPVVGQRVGERRRSIGDGDVAQPVGVAVLQLGAAGLGEALDGGGAGHVGEEAQGAGRQVVVGRGPVGVAGVGEGVQPGRAPAAAQAVRTRLAGRDGAVGEQRVEVLADRGRRQAQPVGERRRGRRSEREQAGADALARPTDRCRHRAPELAHAFHNASVT